MQPARVLEQVRKYSRAIIITGSVALMLILYKKIKWYIISHMKEIFIAGMVIFMGAFVPIIINSFDRYDKNGLTLSVIGLWILSIILASGFGFSMVQAIREAKKTEPTAQVIIPKVPKQRKLNLYQWFILWFYKIVLSLYRKSGLG